ncbi:MAG: phospho-sugar mutase [Thermoleophilia bacterium]
MTPEAGLRDRAEAWIAVDPDPETRAELRAMIDAGDGEGLTDRFAGRLAFGTAGLRGTMAAGPNRMNRVVVRQSAAGIARYLLAHVPGAAEAGVVVAHDARHRSAVFAADVAEVLGQHGIRTIGSVGPLPTPVAVHAIRAVGAAAGIVVTASHNPPRDNGMKLYMGDAAQIIPPVDGLVAAEIARVAEEGGVDWRRPDAPIGASAETIPDAVLEGYRRATLARVPPPAAPIRIATTPMHGVGGAWIADLLARAGHGDVHPVPGQSAPDPDFPTVAFPNPEEPGVTAMLAGTMAAVDADLGIALDPDADRVAVLVRDASVGGSGIRQLTGDQLGALLGEWLLGEVTSGPDRLTVSSVVSSSLLGKVAARHGARHEETLTGFKWLSRPAMEHPEWTQVLAYEEAIGYAIGPEVRDKDGISAGVAVASMASWARARGLTLPAMLDALHERHGAHVTDNFSLRDEAPGGAERRAALVGRLTASPPERVGEERVAAVASLASDVLRIDLAGGTRVVVRPSGTEPKLKCYCEAVEPVADDGVEAARERARARLAAVRAGLEALLLD